MCPALFAACLTPSGRPGTRIYRSSRRYVSDRVQNLRRDRDRASRGPARVQLHRYEAAGGGGPSEMGAPGDTTAKELPGCAGFRVAPSNSLFLVVSSLNDRQGLRCVHQANPTPDRPRSWSRTALSALRVAQSDIPVGCPACGLRSASQPSKLREKARVVLEEHSDVRDPEAQHGDSFHP